MFPENQVFYQKGTYVALSEFGVLNLLRFSTALVVKCVRGHYKYRFTVVTH